jgi:hypothetical protein
LRSASDQAFQDVLSAYLSLAWLHTQYGRGGPSALIDLERRSWIRLPFFIRPQTSLPIRP